MSDSELVHYACIAHQGHHHDDSPDSTILAEFNSADSSLQDLAYQCLLQTPRHHSVFSHTSVNRTYTFLLNDPFVYFGIFDPNMPKHDQIQFLGRLKEALQYMIKGNKDHKFTPYCFQGELHPIFHKLMSKSLDFDALHLIPNGVSSNNTPPPISGSSQGAKILTLPLLSSSKTTKGYKKKRFCGDGMSDSNEALVDGKVDLVGDNVAKDVKSRDIVCQNGLCLIDGGSVVARQKAKKMWRRHVWIVLVLDMAVCLILFGIWLFVCQGFQCIEG